MVAGSSWVLLFPSDIVDIPSATTRASGTPDEKGKEVNDVRDLFLQPDGRSKEPEAGPGRQYSRWALRCPDCDHLDYLRWLSDEAGLVLWGEANRKVG